MNDYSQKLIGTLAAAAVIGLAGCSTGSTAGSTVESSPAPTVAPSPAPTAAASIPALSGMSATALKSASGLYSSLGGASGVNALAQSFGSKLALNPAVTKYLDAAAIDAAKGGLSNTLAALAGQPLPASGSADLFTALQGKGLDSGAVKGMSTALVDAGKEMNLNTEQLGSLSSIMDAMGKMLLK